MFYYIDQPGSPSFPIGLVNNVSNFIVRSVEIGLGRWTFKVAVISDDAPSFVGFLRPWQYKNRCFLVAFCCLIVRRPNLEVATERILHQQVKIQVKTPTATSGGVDISEVPGCNLLRQMSSQWGSQKLLQGLLSHELTAYLSIFNQFLTWRIIIAILSKGCKPDHFGPHNSLKLSFTNVRGLLSNFVEYESFLESNSPDIPALYETNLNDSIDSGNFSVTGYLPSIQKDYIIHMHCLAIYAMEELPLVKSADSYLCFWLFLSFLLLFPLPITFIFMHGFWFYLI